MARPRKTSEAGTDLFPVKLLRNYRPINEFLIDGREPDEMEREKVKAGSEIELPVEEARNIIERGVAVRNDPI